MSGVHTSISSAESQQSGEDGARVDEDGRIVMFSSFSASRSEVISEQGTNM
jgi:hypothetical protein